MDPAVPARRKGPSVLHRLTGAFRRPGKRADPAEWEAFPLIEAAGEVVAGWGLEIRAGLAADPAATGADAGAPALRAPFELDVQVIAEGFEAPGGWRVRLRVDEASPYPAAVLPLVALPPDRPGPRGPQRSPGPQGAGAPQAVRDPRLPPDAEAAAAAVRRIRAVYSVQGQVTGFGTRAVAVLGSPGLLGRDPAPAPAPDPVAGTRIRQPRPGGFADVTAVIAHGDRPGRLWWSYLSPHFVTPDRAELCDLGTRASALGRDLLGRADRADAPSRLRAAAGERLAREVPAGFLELLEAVAARIAPRPPRILLLSEDPYVPWELAALERPLDPSLPAFLDCQAVVGRWSLGGRRPGLPAPPVVRGEASALRDGLAALHGTLAAFGEPAELIGLTVPGGTGGLLRVDGSDPVPRLVAGHRLEGAPFVFLAGGADPDLAPAFLVAGAGGAAAPLWPVGGEAARELALELHRRCLAGEPPAEALRSLRCAGSAAALAYRFSGHPSAVLAPPQSTA